MIGVHRTGGTRIYTVPVQYCIHRQTNNNEKLDIEYRFIHLIGTMDAESEGARGI